jgi:anti-anti-sigma factor
MSDGPAFPIGAVLTGRVDEIGDVLKLSLAGEFDLAGQDAFRALLTELESRRPRAIVVDLGEVTFIDSTGARLLYEAECRAVGWRFAVLDGSAPAHRVLALSGLDRHIAVIDDIEELTGPG